LKKRHRTDTRPTLAYFKNDHCQENCLVDVTVRETLTCNMTMARRTSRNNAPILSKNPFGVSCSHPVKLSEALQLLGTYSLNTEIVTYQAPQVEGLSVCHPFMYQVSSSMVRNGQCTDWSWESPGYNGASSPTNNCAKQKESHRPRSIIQRPHSQYLQDWVLSPGLYEPRT